MKIDPRDDDRCWFCGAGCLTYTNEHYVFCRDCMALYTFMIVHKIVCDHINEDTPVVLHPSVYKCYREEKGYILEAPEGCAPQQYCSVCQSSVIADGW